MLKRTLLALLVALGVSVTPVNATLQIAGDFGGSTFLCLDNNPVCDLNPTIGQIVLNTLTINGVEIVGSSQFQTIGPTNFLNTSSFQVINHNQFDIPIELAISGTDFLGPVNTFTASGSGTWQNADGSSIVLNYFGDAANTQGADTATDLPGLLLATFADLAVGAADAFAFSGSGPFVAAGAYSMSLGTSGVLDAWDGSAGTETTLVGRSQTIITTQQVPEPGTLALIGLAIAGLGFARRKAQA